MCLILCHIPFRSEALVPMRHSLGVGYNIPSALQFAVNFALGFLSEKLRSRARQVSDLSNCPEIDRGILPKEVGGTGSLGIEDMLQLWRAEMARPDVLKLVAQTDEMSANLNLFSKREIEGDFNTRNSRPFFDTENIPGSFRKIEVD